MVGSELLKNFWMVSDKKSLQMYSVIRTFKRLNDTQKGSVRTLRRYGKRGPYCTIVPSVTSRLQYWKVTPENLEKPLLAPLS